MKLRRKLTLAALQKVPLFRDSGFDDAQLKELAKKVVCRTFPEGHYIITQGDVGSVFYLLEKGEVGH